MPSTSPEKPLSGPARIRTASPLSNPGGDLSQMLVEIAVSECALDENKQKQDVQ